MGKPRTKTGRWLVSSEGLDPELLTYHDVEGDAIDLHRMVARIEDEAQSMRWPAQIDPHLLGMALDLVDEEDARVGVVGRGRKVDRVIAEYHRLAQVDARVDEAEARYYDRLASENSDPA